MSEPLSLLVPMHLTALCVSRQDQASGKKFARIADEFQNLAGRPYVGTSVVPPPFQEEDAPAGVHLHWALPDALTHSSARDGAGFRQVPNRFLVVRLAAVSAAPGAPPTDLESRAWVVESDHLWKDEDEAARRTDARNALSRAVPLAGGQGDGLFAFQGRVRALDNAWSDTKADAARRFTAVGYGTEAYAAAYPLCRNVFGFFDPAFDPVHAADGLDNRHRQLSYLVVGWTSVADWDPVEQMLRSVSYKDHLQRLRKDPEERAGSGQEAEQRYEATALGTAFEADLNWSYAWKDPLHRSATAPLKRPARSLFVGHLTALAWHPDQVRAAPPAEPVAVALGTSRAEALSALLARTTGSTAASAVEALLNTLQLDPLPADGTAADQPAAREALHERDFAPMPAGRDTGRTEALFVPGDIRDVAALHARLRDDPSKTSGPVSKWLWGKLPDALTAPAAAGQWTDDVVLEAFNDILRSSSNPLSDVQRFAHVALRPETSALLLQRPVGDKQVRLHRLLLEDTYPDVFDPMQNDTGRIWLLKPAATTEQRLPLPTALAAALDALNESQTAADTLAAAVATRQSQVFADWTKFLVVQDSGIRHAIEQEIQALSGLVAQLAGARLARRQAKGGLKKLLRGMQPPDSYTLETSAAPRFYQPNDPVLVLSGIAPPRRYGGDGRFDPAGRGPLICRLSDATTKSGDFGLLAADRQALLNGLCAEERWTALLPAALPCHDALVALCVEASLLHDGLAALLGKPDLAAQQAAYLAGGGSAPSPVGVERHAQPWLPLLLQWETAFSPFHALVGAQLAPAAYPAGWGLQQFALQGWNPEISYTGADPGWPAPAVATCHGSAPLVHQVDTPLMAQIRRHLQDRGPDDPTEPDAQSAAAPLRSLLQGLLQRQGNTAAQSLSGFHAQLRMRNQTLQMKVNRPPTKATVRNAALRELSEFGSKVSVAAGDQTDASHLEDQRLFNPLRAGLLQLRRLRIVDAFGQIRDLVGPGSDAHALQSSDVIVADRLGKAPWGGPPGTAALPLRITQPARLLFRFRPASFVDGAAAVSGAGDAAPSPVFGWVLFNRFEHALAIHDEEGRPVGAFHLQGPAWQDTPGAHRGVANRQLRDFIAHLGGPKAGDANSALFRGFLRQLIDTIDHALAAIAPADKPQQELALLLGRPLALVGADLRLDLYGSVPAALSGVQALRSLPLIDQSTAALSAATSQDGYDETRRRSADFSQVRFPLRLGDDTKADDGLVGYFVETALPGHEPDPATTYGNFFSHSAAPDGHVGIVRPSATAPDRLSLAAADAGPTRVVLLLDPRAAVHASVGVLPVKRITLPSAHYVDALQRIDATFLVAPVLAGADGVALPVPAEPGRAWAWLSRQADSGGAAVRTWSRQDLVEQPNPRGGFSARLSIHEGWLHLYPVQAIAAGDGSRQAASRPTPFAAPVKPDRNGAVMLGPETARLQGDGVAVSELDDGRRYIAGWSSQQDSASWTALLARGTWAIGLQRLVAPGAADSDALVEVQVIHVGSATVLQTLQVVCSAALQQVAAGEVTVDAACACVVRVRMLAQQMPLQGLSLVQRGRTASTQAG